MLYTIGHSNRPLAAFLALLAESRVARLVDVRAVPRSRRLPHFDGAALTRALAAAGVEYAWRGDALGGFRAPRPDSPHVALSGPFRGFADHMASAQFDAALDALVDDAARAPTAIMCAEKLPAECHRSLISDRLLARGVEVVHLIEAGRREAARLTPGARVTAGGGLAYDAVSQPRLL